MKIKAAVIMGGLFMVLCGCVSESEYELLVRPRISGRITSFGGIAKSEYESLVRQNKDLEQRLKRIEGDLYKVEVKSAPKSDKRPEPKFVPAKEVEPNVINAKIDAFLKEYLGVAFGDSIDKYPEQAPNCYGGPTRRVISVMKKFQYFDKAYAYFEGGKLCAVAFFADIDEKYSVDSTNERIAQTKADLAVTLGLASDVFVSRDRTLRPDYGLGVWLRRGDKYSFGAYDSPRSVPKGFRRLGVVFENRELTNLIRSESEAKARAKGEQLPEIKEAEDENK